MSDDRLTGKVNRVEGEIRSDGRKYLRHSCPGYVYAQSDDGYHAMFFSTHCDQYRIGDKVRIEVTRIEEQESAGEALLDKPWLRKGIVD